MKVPVKLNANGPFLKTVTEELGWPIVAVLKQERYEAHQEALALKHFLRQRFRFE